MFESPPAIVDLGPSSGWTLPAGDQRPAWRLGRVPDCPPSREGEIIVCGRRGENFGIGPLGPDPRPLIEEMADALTFPIGGRIELRPTEVVGARSTGAGIGFRIRF